MTEFEFEQQVTALTQQMYRVSASLLRNPQDRQDAVQECVWKAWRKLPQLRDEIFSKPGSCASSSTNANGCSALIGVR